MNMTFKPLLAAHVTNFDKLQYPMIASPKLDGIRCLITEKGVVARSLKPIPNDYIRETLKDLPIGFDGEIITYCNAGRMEELNTVQSHVMSRDGKPNFKYHVFDSFRYPDLDYDARFPKSCSHPFVEIVPVADVRDYQKLLELEATVLTQGYEGLMLRRPNGRYKFGRSTEKEQILLKVKRFFDMEATVIGKIEQMMNFNEAKTNELGRTERSSAKDGLVGKNTLGALECRLDNGVEFSIGTGLHDELRHKLWNDDKLIGSLVTFKYQRFGPNGAPLLPVFKSIRHQHDT